MSRREETHSLAVSKTTVSPIYNSTKTMVDPPVFLLLRRCSSSLMAATFRGSSSLMAATFRVSSNHLQMRVSDPFPFRVSSDDGGNKEGRWMVDVSPTSWESSSSIGDISHLQIQSFTTECGLMLFLDLKVFFVFLFSLCVCMRDKREVKIE